MKALNPSFSLTGLVSLLFGVLLLSPFTWAEFDLLLESGTVWQNRNDVEIPPGTGSRVPIDEFNEGPFFHYRVEGFWRFNNHHAIRALYAPSTLSVSGRTSTPVTFEGQTFNTTDPIGIRYQFNSYRLSYLYGIWGFGKDQLNVGLTAKVRDADIRFSQNGVTRNYSNVGFVPLIYFEYLKSLGDRWALHFQMDAAAASQGRAIDAALKVRRQVSKSLNLGAGYRTLEGGADNEKVFTFSWFNYAVIDAQINF